jgi:hypothetical protein
MNLRCVNNGSDPEQSFFGLLQHEIIKVGLLWLQLFCQLFAASLLLNPGEFS